MAVLDSIGTSLLVQQQETVHSTDMSDGLTNYIVETADDIGGATDQEDIDTSAGARATRLIFKRDKVVSLNLVAKSAATPITDFPFGDYCTLTGLTSWFVDSVTVAKSRSAQRVNVSMTYLGL